jgi:OmpA-OmpF porin, OOP family
MKRIAVLTCLCMISVAFRTDQGIEKIFLSDAVNTSYKELAPRISPDGKKLFFIREAHPENSSYPEPESQDIWMAKRDESGNWTTARHLNKPFNQSNFNSIVGFSVDGNTRYIKGYYEKGEYEKDGFSVCRLTAKGWSTPVGIRVKNYSNMLHEKTYVSNYMHSDNNILLMSFMGKKKKNNDIYVSFRNGENSFTEPEKLPFCSDASSEGSPFLASDGVTLYFSSDCAGGYGNADIWMVRRTDDTWKNWTTPVNMGPEINSKDWDAYYSIPASGELAYMVSWRNGSMSDIATIKLKPEVQPKPVVLITGKVLNKKTNAPIGTDILCQLLPEGTYISSANSNEETGEYQIILPYGKQYGFNATASGYYPVSENMDLTNLKSYQEIKKDLYLVPVEEGQVVRLNNIFFEFGKAELKAESFPELDRVVELMQKNTTMRIEIGGHTDHVGTDEANAKLSDERANAVRTYLVSKGIAGERITAKGYGESKPLATNDTEEGKAINRRVEFLIVGK